VPLAALDVVKRIVVATDFSAVSDRAVEVTRRLATRFDAGVRLLHVEPPLPLPRGSLAAQLWDGSDPGAAYERESIALLATARARFLDGVASVETRCVHGDSVGEAICEAASDADLCVVGTHGRAGLAHLVLGSVAEQVIRHAPCSVLTVRPTVDAEQFPLRILCAVDATEPIDAGLEQAASLAARFGASLMLLHVHETTSAPFGDPHHARSLRELERLRVALDELRSSRVPFAATEVLIAESAADAIVEHARRGGFDLVVVASRRLAGLTRLLLGSVAEKVTRHAPCPVWTARDVPTG
jgi:nucleotide-binding universal stress UspA family protein